MKLKLLALAALAASSFGAHAAIVHNSNIVGNVIFGSSNQDGGWTINQTGNMELALRAKVRYDVTTGGPLSVYNANGDGTFSHAVGNPGGANAGRGRWNFEWSVNTDASGTGGAKISDYEFVLGVDSDPGVLPTFNTYSLVGNSPVAGAPYDHTFGDNTTPESGGTKATTAALFASLIGTTSLMQNSSNMEFVDDGILFASDFNPNIAGSYSFFLEARDKTTGAVIGRTDITVNVPEPATLALIGLALAGLATTRRRRG